MRGNEDRENGRKEGSGREECEKPGRKTGRKQMCIRDSIFAFQRIGAEKKSGEGEMKIG